MFSWEQILKLTAFAAMFLAFMWVYRTQINKPVARNIYNYNYNYPNNKYNMGCPKPEEPIEHFKRWRFGLITRACVIMGMITWLALIIWFLKTF